MHRKYKKETRNISLGLLYPAGQEGEADNNRVFLFAHSEVAY